MATDADFQPPLTRWGHAWRLALALVISVGALGDSFARRWDAAEAMVVVDIVLGVVAFGLVFLRRRYPLLIAVLTSGLTALSALSNGPAALAMTSLATRRVRAHIAAAASVNLAASAVFVIIRPIPDNSVVQELAGAVVPLVAFVGWGLFVGSRRELLWGLRQRAERAEAEQGLRAAEARANERARIAREMHDVVAHRISQVSMRAGAMAFRDDLSADELRAQAGVIRDTANEALRELRSVLHVLRDSVTGELVEQPQPTYVDIAALAARARAEGMRVDLDDQLSVAPPPEVGRTIYRIVQEGITNAGKHAPGARLHIALCPGEAGGIEVTMSNPRGFGPPGAPGSGLGLVGVAERVAVAGGRFERVESAGQFTVRAWLPSPL